MPRLGKWSTSLRVRKRDCVRSQLGEDGDRRQTDKGPLLSAQCGPARFDLEMHLVRPTLSGEVGRMFGASPRDHPVEKRAHARGRRP